MLGDLNIYKKYKKRPKRDQLIIRIILVALMIYVFYLFIPLISVNLNLLLLTVVGFLSNYYPPISIIIFTFNYIYFLLIGLLAILAFKELFYFLRSYNGIIEKENDDDDDNPFDEDEDIWNLKY